MPYGDPFMIYPGPDGPIDSIRWEVFAESLQDYAMLQTAGIKPDDPLLSELKSYADFSEVRRSGSSETLEICEGPRIVDGRQVRLSPRKSRLSRRKATMATCERLRVFLCVSVPP